MAGEREVRWSEEAMRQVDAIKAFIVKGWSGREGEEFLDLLQAFETLVKRHPKAFEASERYPGCRRATMHRHLSVVYRLVGDTVEDVTVRDNRSAELP